MYFDWPFVEKQLISIVDLINDSHQSLIRGNINKVSLNDDKINKYLRRITSIFRNLCKVDNIHILRLGMHQLTNVQDIVRQYLTFFESNVEVLDAELPVRSQIEGNDNELVSMQYEIGTLYKKLIAKRIMS